MNIELLATIIGTVVTIVALAITIYLTNRSTQKILREIGCVISKIRADTKASAWREGFIVAENVVSEEEAKKLGESYFYDPATKICHYKAKEAHN